MKLSSLIIIASAATLLPAQSATLYTEASDGELSNDLSNPTSVSVMLGSNTVGGQIGQVPGQSGATNGSDADYFSITIPVGQSVTSLTTTRGVAGGSFFGYRAGTGFAGQTGGDIDGFVIFSDSQSILGALAGGPLGPGTYSFWAQETSPGIFDYSLTFEVVPEPSSTLLLSLGALGLLRRRKR